jgi:hypothetical protein
MLGAKLGVPVKNEDFRGRRLTIALNIMKIVPRFGGNCQQKGRQLPFLGCVFWVTAARAVG